MAGKQDDHDAVPILLNPVREAEGVQALRELSASLARSPVVKDPPLSVQEPARPASRVLPGREAQQSLFDDLPVPPPQRTRRGKLPPTLQRMAEDLLRTRAPAIINELADEHARRLSTELRERLRKELARLLAELAEENPHEPGDGGEPAPALPAPDPRSPADGH